MAKKRKGPGVQKPKMTVQEFVARLIDDKEFRRQVLVYCYGREFDSGSTDALPKWLNAGARRMGHRFLEQDFVDEFNRQVGALGFFKRTKTMGALMGAASASKKAHDPGGGRRLGW
jgi:hypothetical protein